MQSALFLKMELTRKIHPLTFFLPGTVTPTKERKTVQEILKNYTFRDFQYILKNTNKHNKYEKILQENSLLKNRIRRREREKENSQSRTSSSARRGNSGFFHRR